MQHQLSDRVIIQDAPQPEWLEILIDGQHFSWCQESNIEKHLHLIDRSGQLYDKFLVRTCLLGVQ